MLRKRNDGRNDQFRQKWQNPLKLNYLSWLNYTMIMRLFRELPLKNPSPQIYYIRSRNARAKELKIGCDEKARSGFLQVHFSLLLLDCLRFQIEFQQVVINGFRSRMFRHQIRHKAGKDERK